MKMNEYILTDGRKVYERRVFANMSDLREAMRAERADGRYWIPASNPVPFDA
jgi:hypothetical protein